VSRYFPPTPKPQLRVRGVAIVEINDKPRPAVVMSIHEREGRALVLYGTGTERDELVVIRVPMSSAAGRSLKLDKPTCFYADGLRSVKLSHLKAVQGHCPPELFMQMRIMIEGALYTRPTGELTKDLAAEAMAPPSAPVGSRE
jgi:hypothetical protein